MAKTIAPNTIVSSKWLHDNLNNRDLVVLDASPAQNKSNLDTSFADLQIKGARHFRIKEDFSDSNNEFPNTFPSTQQFEDGCRKLGINNSSNIVVYDNLGIYTGPRVWWMLKTMGHQTVSVLDGGLPLWIESGYETEARQSNSNSLGNFVANPQFDGIKYFADIQKNIESKEYLLIDARSNGRFNGTQPEPRKGLKGGNIPNSINIPFASVLTNGQIKSEEELKEIFSILSLENRAISFSCGSGITACITLLAHEIATNQKASIYDGSWTEWVLLQE